MEKSTTSPIQVANVVLGGQAYVEQTPGTEILLDENSDDFRLQSRRIHQLQHAQGNSKLILVPQPSLNDPNDPLRWPTWKKWLVFANALDYSFNGSITGPIMAAGSSHFKLIVRFH
jgi:hypothetical protein